MAQDRIVQQLPIVRDREGKVLPPDATALNRQLRDMQQRLNVLEGRAGTVEINDGVSINGSLQLNPLDAAVITDRGVEGLTYFQGDEFWGQEKASDGIYQKTNLIQGAQQDSVFVGKASDFNFTSPMTATLDRTNDKIDVGVNIGSVFSLEDLSDVTITSATTGEVLTWNGSAWVNSADIDNISLDDLTDVTISTATNTQIFMYSPDNSGLWKNEFISVLAEDTNPDPDLDFAMTYDASATRHKKVALQNLNQQLQGIAFSTGETNLGSSETQLTSYDLTLPANAMTTGDVMLFRGKFLASTNTNTKTLRLYVGASSAAIIYQSSASVASAIGEFQMWVNNRSTATGSVQGQYYKDAAPAGTATVVVVATALTGMDSTTSQLVKLTAQGAATADITMQDYNVILFKGNGTSV